MFLLNGCHVRKQAPRPSFLDKVCHQRVYKCLKGKFCYKKRGSKGDTGARYLQYLHWHANTSASVLLKIIIYLQIYIVFLCLTKVLLNFLSVFVEEKKKNFNQRKTMHMCGLIFSFDVILLCLNSFFIPLICLEWNSFERNDSIFLKGIQF